MKTISIQGASGASDIMIGENIGNLATHIPSDRSVIITDTRVRELYGNRFPDVEVIEVGLGEGIKTLDTVSYIYDRLLGLEADRSMFIVGIGGGIVCDITGFVASTYLRGVRFGFVSSTLLSQVDASVGGKNGVNFEGYKNMVGVFNQPEFVICDLDMLKTLPEPELQCGFAEIVKHGAISDVELFGYLEANYEKALALDSEVMEKLVFDSVVIKSDIVNRDEKEQGERRKLNFGHTFGHAIEKTTGVRHGEAVSAGMAVACALSVKKGMLSPADASRVETLLEHLKLPARLPLDREKALDAIKKDKKREGGNIHFVLLDGLGHAVVEQIAIRELEGVLDAL